MKIQFNPIINYIKPQNKSIKENYNPFQYNHNINFDTISFSGKTIAQQIKELPSETFLSKGLRDYILDNVDKRNIPDLHKEYYAPLMSCQTLDEAKELYPEFSNVIDIKDLDLNNISNRTILKIAKGQIKGLNKENASIVFLQKYISKLEPPKSEEKYYFDINHHTITGLLEFLNISMDKNYKDIIKKCRMSQARKNIWQNEDFRKQALTERKSPKARQKHSQAAKIMWQNEQYRQRRILKKQSKNKNRIEG